MVKATKGLRATIFNTDLAFFETTPVVRSFNSLKPLGEGKLVKGDDLMVI